MSERPAGRSRWSALAVVGAAYAAVTAITSLLWLLDAGGWLLLPFDLFSFWWPLPAAALLAMALRRGARSAALMLAVPVLFWLVVHGGLFLPRLGSADGDLTIASLNVLVRTESTEQLEALVAAHDPDVVFLQEIFSARMDVIRERLGEHYPHVHLSGSRVVGGVALLSKRPIDSVTEIPRPHERARGSFVAVIDGVQYVPVHLTSPCPSCGDSLAERLAGEDAARHLEMEAVIAALDPTMPAVVGGDFNSTARGDPYRLLVDAGFLDVQREAGWGPGFTWSTVWPLEVLRIDWIMTRGLQPTRAFVGAAGPSDHRPVVTELVLP